MNSHLRILLLVSFFLGATCAYGQKIAYVYPAGGQQGTSFEVIVGGQGLDNPLDAYLGGAGISVEIVEHNKLPPQVILGDVRVALREIQGKMKDMRSEGKIAEGEGPAVLRKLLAETEFTEKDLRFLVENDFKRTNPKQQLNPQLAESVRAKVTIASDAAPGVYWWRLRTERGLSNPIRFIVGQIPEVAEPLPPVVYDFENYRGYRDEDYPSRKKIIETKGIEGADSVSQITLPAVVNGRIMPGEVDTIPFIAKKGDQVVISVAARNVIPYLPDAVPGWFQAVAAVTNSKGEDVAYAGGYLFNPDPVLFYKIPEDGQYRISIRDSIYRGREDFVYRITVGELPFLTGVFPLGATAGSQADLVLSGGNLLEREWKRYQVPEIPGIIQLRSANGELLSNPIPFQVDDLSEMAEREPNDRMGVGTEVRYPIVMNGTISAPGDADFYRIRGGGNSPMVFEVFARRLSSPLDSILTVYDDDGKEIAMNDDHEDPGSGLTTHHADSRVMVKIPRSGLCFVRVTDAQNHGGPNYIYRLRVTPGKPDFDLRLTPSSLNARIGGGTRLTVHVLRKEGYEGEVHLKLIDAPEYLQLNNAVVPADKDEADISVSVDPEAPEGIVTFKIQGSGTSDGRSIVADGIPSEDMMQAFAYRHLVPVDSLALCILPRAEDKQ